MSPEETVMLARYVRALCPQQKFDEYTPDAWGDLLGDVPLEDAREAAARIARRQPFVAPAEILAEVRKIRGERLEGFRYVPQPDDADTARYLANMRAQQAAVASGQRAADPAVRGLAARPVEALLAGVGQKVPGEEQQAGSGGMPGRRAGSLTVECPQCKARVGRRCKGLGGKEQARVHGVRRRLAAGEPERSESPEEIERRREMAARLLERASGATVPA